jgi:Predicted periplasmic solute-binding protein
MKKITTRVLLLTICLLFVSCSSGGSVSKKNTGSRMLQENTSGGSSEVIDSSSSDSAPSSSSTPQSSSQASSASSQTPVSSSQNSSSSSAPQPKATVNVTIVPGESIPQIAEKLEEKQVCSKADFLSTVNSYDFSYYSLVSQIQYNPANRCYKLEGYLYPDTYTFYVNMEPQDAIGKMLKNAESKIGTKYSYQGMTTDQIITLASIIEKEAPDLANMRKVSDVFHNRLDPANKFSYLNSEATRKYLTNYIASVSNDLVEKYKYFYNTCPVNGEARAKGLPAGPICSPGANALSAAVNPDTSNFYLYFYSDKDGIYHYSATGNDIS